MHYRLTTRVRAWGCVTSLITLGACASADPVGPAFDTDAAKFSQAAADGTAHGISAVDTSIFTDTELRVSWAEAGSKSANVKSNKVATPPTWTVRDTGVVRQVSVSGASVLLAAKSIGSTYVVGRVGPRYDSVKVTVIQAPPVTPASAFLYRAPAPPARTVPTTYPVMSGTSRRVANGANLQAVLDAAQPGDEVVLASGATFTGNYVLRAKAVSDKWIVVRAESVPVPQGTRTSPGVAAGAAAVVTPNNEPAIATDPGASKYRLVGFQVAHRSGAVYNYGIVVLSRGDEGALSQLSSDIILDRMYIHGSPTDGTSRCVAMNGISQAVIDSWLGDCHAKGNDAQGVGGWGGPGPFLIENNHIEASGEIILFGGSDPNIANVTPSDITIRRNHLFKPMSWAGKWTVKAVFELKNARRVLFEGNVLENHWADAQTGFAILLQALTQDNRAPWSTIQDVLIQNNVIRNSASGVNLLRRYNAVVQQGTARVAIANNLFQEVGRDPVSGDPNGRVVQMLDAVEDITLVNNTATLSGATAQAVGFDGEPTVRTSIVNNVFPATNYGVFGSGQGSGNTVIRHYMPGGLFVGNILTAQNGGYYPENNFFPDNAASIIFQAPSAGDFSLSTKNSFYSGTMGRIGVNMTQLNSKISGVIK